jgi:hypothetical protein
LATCGRRGECRRGAAHTQKKKHLLETRFHPLRQFQSLLCFRGIAVGLIKNVSGGWRARAQEGSGRRLHLLDYDGPQRINFGFATLAPSLHCFCLALQAIYLRTKIAVLLLPCLKLGARFLGLRIRGKRPTSVLLNGVLYRRVVLVSIKESEHF